jgi:GntR family transcriptional regulator
MAERIRRKPRYIELAEHFTARIARGDYPVGGLLPTELDICEKFSVSRHTARAALGQLLAAGLVQRRSGAGTRVIAPRSAMRYQHEVDSVEDLLQYGNSTRLEVLSCVRERADAALAELLEIAVGSEVVRIHARRLEEPARIAIASSEIVLAVQRGVPTEKLLNPDTAARTIARFLDPAKLSRVEQIFDAVRFPKADAAALGIAASSPAMRVQRRYRGDDGRVLAYAISLHPSGRFAYRMHLARRGA